MFSAASVRRERCVLSSRNRMAHGPRFFQPHRREAVAMRMMVHRLLGAALLAAALTRPARAQNTITIEGSVKSAGVPIAGAEVTVVNVATQETAKASTRPSGEFRVLVLFSGQYTVTVRT